MSFRPVFLAVVIAFALILAAFLLNLFGPRLHHNDADFPFRRHAAVLFEIQSVLAEIRGVKKEWAKRQPVGVDREYLQGYLVRH